MKTKWADQLARLAEAIPLLEVDPRYFEPPANLTAGDKMQLNIDPDSDLPGHSYAIVAPRGRCVLDGKPGCWTVDDLERDDPTLDMVHQGYTYVDLANGTRLATAVIPSNLGHAAAHLTGEAARDYMGNNGLALGRYRFSWHELGLVCAGIVWPEVAANEREIATFFASPVSLDARPQWWARRAFLEDENRYALAGAVLVNIPGMPISRVASADDDGLCKWTDDLIVERGTVLADGAGAARQRLDANSNESKTLTASVRKRRAQIYQTATQQLAQTKTLPRGTRLARRKQILAQRSQQLKQLRDETRQKRVQLAAKHKHPRAKTGPKTAPKTVVRPRVRHTNKPTSGSTGGSKSDAAKDQVKQARERLRIQHRTQTQQLADRHRAERQDLNNRRATEGTNVPATAELRALVEQHNQDRKTAEANFAAQLKQATSIKQKTAIRAERTAARQQANDTFTAAKESVMEQIRGQLEERRLTRQDENEALFQRHRAERTALHDQQKTERDQLAPKTATLGDPTMPTETDPAAPAVGATVTLDDGTTGTVTAVADLDGVTIVVLDDGRAVDLDMIEEGDPAAENQGDQLDGTPPAKPAALTASAATCRCIGGPASHARRAAADGADPDMTAVTPGAPELSDEQISLIADRVAAILAERDGASKDAADVDAGLASIAAALDPVLASAVVIAVPIPEIETGDEVLLADGQVGYACETAEAMMDGQMVVKIQLGLSDDAPRVVARTTDLMKTGRRKSYLWETSDTVVDTPIPEPAPEAVKEADDVVEDPTTENGLSADEAKIPA